MLLTFKSKAAADVYMYPEHARMLLELMGKEVDPPEAPRGVITVEQLPQALAALKGAAARAAPEDEKTIHSFENLENKPTDPLALPVSMAQRAWPLIDMLERAQTKGVVVTWGL